MKGAQSEPLDRVKQRNKERKWFELWTDDVF